MTVDDEQFKYSGLRFTRLRFDSQVSAGNPRRGVYVLTFADGYRYVGQTIDIVARLAAHRRRWFDITDVAFSPVPKAKQLDPIERHLIKSVGRTHSLRNIALTSTPFPSPTLSALVDPRELTDWFAVPADESMFDRVDDSAMRAASLHKYQELASHSEFPEIVRLLALFVDSCLPAPRRTERRVWALSSMPSTGRTASSRRLTTLSVGPIEALVISDNGRANADVVRGFLNVAPPVGKARMTFAGLVLRRGISSRREYGYTSIGPVRRVSFDSLSGLEKLLSDPVVVQQARNLIVNLMFKGSTVYGRYHDFNLADHIVK